MRLLIDIRGKLIQSVIVANHEVTAEVAAAETRKVVWPTRNETLQATAIVFVFVLIMALFMWVVDGILLWIVKKLIGGE